MGCEMAGGSSHSDGRRRVGLSSLECHSGPRAPHRAAPPPERMWRRNPSAGRLSRSLASRITPPTAVRHPHNSARWLAPYRTPNHRSCRCTSLPSSSSRPLLPYSALARSLSCPLARAIPSAFLHPSVRPSVCNQLCAGRWRVAGWTAVNPYRPPRYTAPPPRRPPGISHRELCVEKQLWQDLSIQRLLSRDACLEPL